MLHGKIQFQQLVLIDSTVKTVYIPQSDTIKVANFDRTPNPREPSDNTKLTRILVRLVLRGVGGFYSMCLSLKCLSREHRERWALFTLTS